MKENFIRQQQQRGLLLNANGFGRDNPAAWLELPSTYAGQRIVAISVGPRSDCDMFLVETADYKDDSALVCAVGAPLVGPFNPPIKIRPYYTLDTPSGVGAYSGYQVEVQAWCELPRAFMTARAPKLYCAPLTPQLGGQIALAPRDNTPIWTFGRRRVRCAVHNQTAGGINVSVWGTFQLVKNAVEPLNMRRKSNGAGTPTTTTDINYRAAAAIAAGAFLWFDVDLVGGPTFISLVSDVSDELILAQAYVQGEAANG